MSTDFLQLGISREINNILAENEIIQPTPIQEQTIPLVIAGKDIIAQSQTGTGKTLAFLLPVIAQLDTNKPHIQALVITPTRELALQITQEAAKLAEPLNINVLSIYGGQMVDRQIKKIKGNPQLVIGTPGRLLDHLRRKTINIEGVSRLVLDEADQMLQMGFLDDVEELIRQTKIKRQVMLFSATIPAKIRALAARYMNKPADIRVQSQNVTLDEIKQTIVEASEQQKLDKLCKLIDECRPYLAIVFCHTKQRAIALNTSLAERGYEADELHGDLSQAQRERVLKRFSDAKLQILVATDIAARGLDIEGVTHIFNYDIPHDADSYIHRIGRTGRAGEKGMAITFVTPEDQFYLRIIQQGIRASIEKHSGNRPKSTAVRHKKGLYNREKSSKPDHDPSKPNPYAAVKKKVTHKGLNQRSRRNPK